MLKIAQQFPCNEHGCTKAFTRSSSLKRHWEQDHGIAARYSCETCSSDFSRRDLLVRHRKIHSGEDVEYCQHCHRGFGRGYLARHMPKCRSLSSKHTGAALDVRHERPVTPKSFDFVREQRNQNIMAQNAVKSDGSQTWRPIRWVNNVDPNSHAQLSNRSKAPAGLTSPAPERTGNRSGELRGLVRHLQRGLEQDDPAAFVRLMSSPRRGQLVNELYQRWPTWCGENLSPLGSQPSLPPNGDLTFLLQKAMQHRSSKIACALVEGEKAFVIRDVFDAAVGANMLPLTQPWTRQLTSLYPNCEGPTRNELLLMATVDTASNEVREWLIDVCRPLDEPGEESETPLLFAVSYGDLDTARLLLSHGVNPNGVSTNSMTPLMRACSAGNLDLVRLLVASGAHPNILPRPDGSEHSYLSALYCACKSPKGAGGLELLEYLLDSGADSNLGNQRYLPLEAAITRNSAAAVEALLQRGADVSLLPSLPTILAILKSHSLRRKASDPLGSIGPAFYVESAEKLRLIEQFWARNKFSVAPRLDTVS